tara:strand:+ start:200 stop:361 length:162 start_codon:yes stop_codon:yes gene_type:complete
MNKDYFYRLKEKFKLRTFSSDQPKAVWILVLTLNLIGFIGYFVLNFYDINLNK